MKIAVQFIMFVGIILLFGCASPASQISQAPVNDIVLAEVKSDPERFKQSLVRWGGRIVNVVEVGEAKQANTTLRVEVLELPLDDHGEPLRSEPSSGRFVAVITPPYKKSAYYRHRFITFTGKVSGVDERPLASGHVQVLPMIEVQEKYTWNASDDRYRGWPRFFYGFGISRRNIGFGVTFY